MRNNRRGDAEAVYPKGEQKERDMESRSKKVKSEDQFLNKGIHQERRNQRKNKISEH